MSPVRRGRLTPGASRQLVRIPTAGLTILRLLSTLTTGCPAYWSCQLHERISLLLCLPSFPLLVILTS